MNSGIPVIGQHPCKAQKQEKTHWKTRNQFLYSHHHISKLAQCRAEREPVSPQIPLRGKESMIPLMTLTPVSPPVNPSIGPSSGPTTRPAQGSGDYFFNCTDTNTRLQGLQRIMKTWPHKRNKNAPIIDPKKCRSTNCLIQNSRNSSPRSSVSYKRMQNDPSPQKSQKTLHEQNEKVNKDKN